MNENTDNQLTLTDTGPLHKCPTCGKGFSSPNGLRMHNARVHTKTLGTGYRWKTGKNKEERMAHRRKYQKKLRARYYREGKNSRGQQMPPGWMPRNSVKWSPERRERFQNTVKKRAAERLGHSKRIQYVYTGKDFAEDIDLQKVAQQVTKAVMRFCPYCGENIERHKI